MNRRESARQQLSAQVAAEKRPAVVLMHELEWTPENCRRIAAEFLATEGDIPEGVMQSFSMTGPGIAEDAQQQRAEHFKRLGQPVPAYAGDYPR